MMTRNEKRRLAKIEIRKRVAAARASKKLRKALIGGTFLAAVGGFAGSLGYWWTESSPSGGRGPASVAPGGPGKESQGQDKGKTLEEAQKEINEKNAIQRKAKEWVWAEEGHTELVIDAYKKVTGMSSHAREERSRILKALGSHIRPRKEWPKEFNDSKAREVLEFVTGIVKEGHGPGSDAMSGIHILVAYANAMPEYKGRAEETILEYYAEDDRVAPRSACLQALSEIHSMRALPYLRQAMLSTEASTSRSALYALGNYLGTPLEKTARELLVKAAGNTALRPLAVKLMAYHLVKDAGAFVPKLLTGTSTPAEIEAAAYTVEQLKLKQYRGLLEKYGKADSPFLQQQLDAAFKAIGPSE